MDARAATLVLDVADAAVSRRSQVGAAFSARTRRFAVGAGERLALVGPSGSGKSTFLDLLALLTRPEAVARFLLTPPEAAPIDIAAAAAIPPHRFVDATAHLRASRIAYIPQRAGLMPFLSAHDNILSPPGARAALAAEPGRFDRLVAALRISQVLASKPRALSVGEQQRVALARGLITRPALLLADEPTAALDPELSVETLSLLAETAEREQVALVIATHDVDLAARLGFELVRRAPCADGAAGRCSEFNRPPPAGVGALGHAREAAS